MNFVKGRGADCALFLAKVYQNCGILNKVEKLKYSRSWMLTSSQELMLEGFERHFKNYLNQNFNYLKIKYSNKLELSGGDILCFCTNNSKLCHHAGLYLGKNRFIHSMNRSGVINTQLHYIWESKLRYIFRVVEQC